MFICVCGIERPERIKNTHTYVRNNSDYSWGMWCNRQKWNGHVDISDNFIVKYISL